MNKEFIMIDGTKYVTCVEDNDVKSKADYFTLDGVVYVKPK